MSRARYRSSLLVALSAVFALTATAAIPPVGEQAPQFTLLDGDGIEISLADHRGSWVVLFFYPKDFGRGCTIQVREFQRDLAKYQAAGAVVLGVSVFSTASHRSFRESESLELTLLSDPDADVSARYGSIMEHQGQTLSARNTFLIDPEGRLVRAFEQVNPEGHSSEVLSVLAELGQ